MRWAPLQHGPGWEPRGAGPGKGGPWSFDALAVLWSPWAAVLALLPWGCLTAGPSPLRRALGISVTDYTFEDCQLALAEGQLRLPADTCLLEFARLVRRLG